MALPILCYHQVGTASEWGRRLNIEPETLNSHINFFRRRGWRFVRAENLSLDAERTVCFTFDDAYAAAVHHLEGVADRFTASVYAVPSLVGLTSAWESSNARPLACWDSLRNLARLGFEIGNHTSTHAAMGNLSLEEQLDEWNLANSRLKAEGLPARSCCLPYGSRNEHSRAAIEQAGFLVGLGLGRRAANRSDDPRLLPRIVVGYSDRLPGLIYRIWLRPLLPTLKHRADYLA
ncbi:MAG: hypothetical protein HONBIEJF_01301 [Fimbriimonadaceae bacterium]|nr:hypothetical protein [Fimbriimonadaceae bacterium]